MLLTAIALGNLNAQVQMKGTLQNMHLWRGMEVTDGMVLTTDVSFTDRNERFRVGFWGGMNTSGNYKEFNNYLSYTYQRFNISLWDTYNFSKGATYNNEEFFNYNAKETGRFLDASIAYTWSEKFPLSLKWATVIFGRDRDGMNAKNRYSTFVYAEYPLFRSNEWEVRPGVGGAFALSPGKDAEGVSVGNHFYGTGAGIVHLSITTTYQLVAFQRSFPISAMALWNPQSNKGYLQLGVQLFSF